MRVLYALTLVLALAAGCASKSENASPPAQQAQTSSKIEAILLDVRTPGEYKLEHLLNAVNLPVNDIEQKIAQVAPDKTTPLMVHCAAGARSARAKAKLDAMGYTNVRDLGSYDNARQVVEGQR